MCLLFYRKKIIEFLAKTIFYIWNALLFILLMKSYLSRKARCSLNVVCSGKLPWLQPPTLKRVNRLLPFGYMSPRSPLWSRSHCVHICLPNKCHCVHFCFQMNLTVENVSSLLCFLSPNTCSANFKVQSEQAVLLTSAPKNLRDLSITSKQHVVNDKQVKLSSSYIWVFFLLT